MSKPKTNKGITGWDLSHNAYPKGEQLFVPAENENEDYYFVDYFDTDEVRWVRTPSQTLSEVTNILNYISDEGKSVERFRVNEETWLSQLHRSWDETTRDWVTDDYTNRQCLFGDREERFAASFFGMPSLSPQGEESFDDWKERVVKDPRSFSKYGTPTEYNWRKDYRSFEKELVEK